MGWQFEQSMIAVQAGAVTCMAFDGRDVWVAAGTTINVYSYWDQNSDYERLTQNYYFENNATSLYLVATITAPGTVRAMTGDNGKMFVLTSATNIEVYSTTTHTSTGHITVEQSVQPVLTTGDNALWAISSLPEEPTDQQRLYRYDLLTSTFSSALITGRKQYIVRDIAHGLDGYMYVTSHNEHEIVKVDSRTGAMVSVHRVNRHPNRLVVGQNKTVYIGSDAQGLAATGMLSGFDQSTNTSTNIGATGGGCKDIGLDERRGEAWFIGGNVTLGRLNLTTNDFRFLPNQTNTPMQSPPLAWYPPFPGWTITPGVDPNSDATPYLTTPASNAALVNVTGIVTPKLTVQRWNGTGFDNVTVYPYMFVANLGTSGLVQAYRLSAMKRVNSTEVLGTAMIATGDQAYYGD